MQDAARLLPRHPRLGALQPERVGRRRCCCSWPTRSRFDDVARRAARARAGREPDGRRRAVVRRPGHRLAITGQVTPELQYVALRRRVRADRRQRHRAPASRSRDRRDRRRRRRAPLLADVLAAVGDPLVGRALRRRRGLQRAGDGAAPTTTTQAEADQLLAAGRRGQPAHRLRDGRASRDGDVRVVMPFEDADQARTNADTRAIAGRRGRRPGRAATSATASPSASVTRRRATSSRWTSQPGRGQLRALRPHHRTGALRDLLSGSAGPAGVRPRGRHRRVRRDAEDPVDLVGG